MRACVCVCVCVCVLFVSLTLFHTNPPPSATIPPLTSGRPARKLFRLSYVEGSIYLTWSGKFGNQGVCVCVCVCVRLYVYVCAKMSFSLMYNHTNPLPLPLLQGVDLAEVTAVVSGITTETVRRTAVPERAAHYISLICPGRSVDLEVRINI